MQSQPTAAIATRRRPIQLPKRFEDGGVRLGWDPDPGNGAQLSHYPFAILSEA